MALAVSNHPGLNGGGQPQDETPILVVEDDPQLRQMLQCVLEDEGLAVEAAANGQEAVERATRTRPALAVLDWNLPGLPGRDVAVRLRAQHDGVPILLVSAQVDLADKARQVGAFAHLSKPFDLDELLEAVRHGLDARPSRG